MRTAIVILAALSATASAEVALGVHIGGGMEGGMFSGAVRPDAMMEAGMSAQLLDGNGNGIGASVEAVGRLTPRMEDTEEIKADGMFRFARGNGRLRGGVGAGIRVLSAPGGQTIHGYDMFRMDMSTVLARWEIDPRAPELQLEGYVSWTFGCYSDSYDGERSGDMKPVRREISCIDSITTTYVVGLRTTVSWR